MIAETIQYTGYIAIVSVAAAFVIVPSVLIFGLLGDLLKAVSK
jgi:hypothetical protein